MSALGCCLWWFVLGALAGWLGSWLLNRLFGRSDVREIPETRVAAPVAVAPASAPVAPVAVAPPRVAGDDLTIIEGIGPKIAELLRRNGIDTFAALSRSDFAALSAILTKAGPRFALANPGTWPAQAEYCVRGDWTGLKRYQDELYAGVQLLGGETRPAPLPLDLGAARAAGFVLEGAGDLEIIEGIGPMIAALLRESGIRTFAELAAAAPAEIRAVLDKGGPQFRVADPGTWPEQAAYCVRNDWSGLRRLQDRLTAGRA